MSEHDGKPFGTGPGVFGCYGPVVRIVVGPLEDWHFEYESSEEAEIACRRLQDALATDDPLARQLANEFSLPNMKAFLGRFLPRSGLVAFVRPALLLLDRFNGLHEVTDQGQRSVHVEDRIPSTAEWKQIQEVSQNGIEAPLGMKLLRDLKLDSGYLWGMIAHIRDSDGPDSWVDASLLPPS